MKKPKQKTKTTIGPPGEIIGDWEYFYGENGALHRALAGQPVETRRVEFVVPKEHGEFALRCARLKAGLAEYAE